jgi:hypothetical protein
VVYIDFSIRSAFQVAAAMDLTLVLSILFLSCLHGVSSDRRYFTSLFTLGDSYIDAGNFVIMAARMVPPVPVWHDKPPYGMTFFGYPTGRLSDGRIITDFIGMLSDLMPCTKRLVYWIFGLMHRV